MVRHVPHLTPIYEGGHSTRYIDDDTDSGMDVVLAAVYYQLCHVDVLYRSGSVYKLLLPVLAHLDPAIQKVSV